MVNRTRITQSSAQRPGIFALAVIQSMIVIIGAVVADVRADDSKAQADKPADDPPRLIVAYEFEGASAVVTKVDDVKRLIHITPQPPGDHGWPCWWYFKVTGIQPGEILTIQVSANEQKMHNGKVLWAGWTLGTRDRP